MTEQIFEKYLRELGYYSETGSIDIESKKSTKLHIQTLLPPVTQKNEGEKGGFPGYIIRDSLRDDVAMIIECKADTAPHRRDESGKHKNDAMDGTYLHENYLFKDLDVIYLGISGQSESEFKVSHFVKLRGQKNHQEIFKGCGLQYFSSYLEQLKKHRFRVGYSALLEYVEGLNKQLHGKRIPEKQRAILFSGILLALEDEIFRNTYENHANSSDLMDALIARVIVKLNAANSNAISKFEGLKTAFSDLKHSPALVRNGYLKDLVKEIDEKVRSFIKSYEYHDIVSRCYVEFLKYANDDGSLGIVLTPNHITELFCLLAGVNKDSVVLDNCCGTAGFLVAAMGKMVSDANGDKNKIEHIQKNQLIGVEYQPHIFNLAVSNMIIHSDGKSNIVHEDCFKSSELIKPFKPTIALLNPPFNDGSGIDELEFVEHALNCLEHHGTAIAIVPMSCAMYDKGVGFELKRRLLRHHTLVASMSLPNQLFNDKGVNTCALVFKAHIPHDEKRKTWFGYWRDDGFIKSKRKRQDSAGKWDSIKDKWVDSFIHKKIETGFSLLQSVNESNEWLCEAYIETDYSTISQEDFEREVKRFTLYNLMLEIQGGAEDENVETT